MMVCELCMLSTGNLILGGNVIEDKFMVWWNKFDGEFSFNIVSVSE